MSKPADNIPAQRPDFSPKENRLNSAKPATKQLEFSHNMRVCGKAEKRRYRGAACPISAGSGTDHSITG
ncbi:MAG: hypothetical protein ACWA44_15055 [Thiotrichales bacterium]